MCFLSRAPSPSPRVQIIVGKIISKEGLPRQEGVQED